MEGGEEGSLSTGEGNPWIKIEEVEQHLENHEDKSEVTKEKKLKKAKAESKASENQSQKKGVISAQKKSSDLKEVTAPEKVCPADGKISNPNAKLTREPGDDGSELPHVELSGGTPSGAAGTD